MTSRWELFKNFHFLGDTVGQNCSLQQFLFHIQVPSTVYPVWSIWGADLVGRDRGRMLPHSRQNKPLGVFPRYLGAVSQSLKKYSLRVSTQVWTSVLVFQLKHRELKPVTYVWHQTDLGTTLCSSRDFGSPFLFGIWIDSFKTFCMDQRLNAVLQADVSSNEGWIHRRFATPFAPDFSPICNLKVNQR